MSVEKNDELIIQNWNSVVNKRDTVFILGDISMDKPDIVENCLKQLKGNIKVILGNHDTFRVCHRLFQMGIKVCGCVKYDEFFLSHIPVHIAELTRYGRIVGNIHGHIHLPGALSNEELFELPQDKYFNVNCEFHSYTPVSYELIKDYFNNIN